MTRTKVSKYYRSTNLERDLNNKSSPNLVITDAMLRTARYVYDALDVKTSDSAISVVGPYGSGKSTSAVTILRHLTNTLEKKYVTQFNKNQLNRRKFFSRKQIITITGERESLEKGLKRKLGKKFRNKRPNVSGMITHLSKDNPLILVIDEFGKYLEYAADNPDDGDIYLLQQLAEIAHRSDGRFILITIRHQALSAYAKRLSNEELNEWKKIQGRFLEVMHANPLTESLAILSKAMEIKWHKKTKIDSSIRSILDQNQYLTEESVYDHLSKCYPIHPIAAILMVSVFQRLAQNQRSMFSFLSTNEPHSLRRFNKQHPSDLFMLDNLYDYLVYNLRNVIIESEISELWTSIDVTIASLTKKKKIPDKHLENCQRILKVVGMIEVFGKEVGLRPDFDTIESCSFIDIKKDNNHTGEILKILIATGVLTERDLFGTYHLWMGSDINLPDLIRKEISLYDKNFDFAHILNTYFAKEPLVARALQIKKGTFRYAEWQFINSDSNPSLNKTSADGLILCFISGIRDKSKPKISKIELDGNVLALWVELNSQQLLYIKYFAALQRLLTEDQRLLRDRIARTEARELSELYRNRVNKIFHITDHRKVKLKSLSKKSSWTNVSWSNISSLLSKKLDDYYYLAPSIHNELINTDNPTPSAISGLKILLYAMFESCHKKDLGLEGKGSAYGMYLSLLKTIGIHRKQNKRYGLYTPKKLEPQMIGPLWNNILDQIKNTNDSGEPINLFSIQESLREQPFGVKKGLGQFLTLAVIQSEFQNLSIYERGTFTPIVQRDTIERMLKIPKNFSIQYVPTKGVHKELFQSLGKIVGDGQQDFFNLLEIVKPLIKFANRLPYYTRHTNNLEDQSRKVLKALLNSSRPETLIFEEIPSALGIEKVSENPTKIYLSEYVEGLESVHNDLRLAYNRLKERCKKHFVKFWRLKGNTYKSIRKELRARYDKQIMDLIVDSKERALANRITDEKLSDKEWFDSLLAVLADKPVDRWNDGDFNTFQSEVQLRYLQYVDLNRHVSSNISSGKNESKAASTLMKKMTKILESSDLTEEDLQIIVAKIFDRYAGKTKAN